MMLKNVTKEQEAEAREELKEFCSSNFVLMYNFMKLIIVEREWNKAKNKQGKR